MEPLLPYFLLLCEFFILCNFDARFLRPNFQEKDKIQKKAKQKERKNMMEVKGSHLRKKLRFG